jgi:DNA invertase Pin-like site-specific DNA recombinase
VNGNSNAIPFRAFQVLANLAAAIEFGRGQIAALWCGERSMIRERVMAGLSRAKADGTQLGRRRIEDTDADKVAAIIEAARRGNRNSADRP